MGMRIILVLTIGAAVGLVAGCAQTPSLTARRSAACRRQTCSAAGLVSPTTCRRTCSEAGSPATDRHRRRTERLRRRHAHGLHAGRFGGTGQIPGAVRRGLAPDAEAAANRPLRGRHGCGESSHADRVQRLIRTAPAAQFDGGRQFAVVVEGGPDRRGVLLGDHKHPRQDGDGHYGEQAGSPRLPSGP
jgi:hypothetical protein